MVLINFLKRHKRKILILIICVSALIIFINYRIIAVSNKFIAKDFDNVPKSQAVLLLGAKVKGDGRPSGILKDRIDTAIELYRSGKAGKILVTGDHGTKQYDEVNAMKNYLLENNIPRQDIFLDHAGFDTYDSLYRARDIFQAESLIVVTQNFHLNRAIFIGKKLDMNVIGFSADKHVYRGMWQLQTREVLARTKAYFTVMFKIEPKFLGPVIPLTGDSGPSWDIFSY